MGTQWDGRLFSYGWGDGRWWGFGFSRPVILSNLIFRWLLAFASDLGRCFRTKSEVRPGHVAK